MVGRVMPKDIGIAQGGLPVVEATGEIDLLELEFARRIWISSRSGIDRPMRCRPTRSSGRDDVRDLPTVADNPRSSQSPPLPAIRRLDSNSRRCLASYRRAFGRLVRLGPCRSGHKVPNQWRKRGVDC